MERGQSGTVTLGVTSWVRLPIMGPRGMTKVPDRYSVPCELLFVFLLFAPFAQSQHRFFVILFYFFVPSFISSILFITLKTLTVGLHAEKATLYKLRSAKGIRNPNASLYLCIPC